LESRRAFQRFFASDSPDTAALRRSLAHLNLGLAIHGVTTFTLLLSPVFNHAKLENATEVGYGE
jgi:hypothetical protein